MAMTDEEFEQGQYEEIHRAENVDFPHGEIETDPRDYLDATGVDLYEEADFYERLRFYGYE